MKELIQAVQKGEPEWVTLLRQEAWGHYETMPMPQRNEEDWRRTDLRRFRLDDYAPTLVEKVTQRPEGHRAAEGYLATQMQHDSSLVYSEGEKLDNGVIFTDLATAVREHGDRVKPYLFQTIPLNFNRLTALEAALWQGGTFLYVPKGIHLDQPLHTLISLQTEGRADFSHTVIVLEEDASATLVREWASRVPDTSGLHIGSVEIHVGAGSHLAYYDLQQWNERTWDFSVQRARLERDSQLNWFTGVIGSRLSKNYHEVYLDGSGAEAHMRGLVLAKERQHLDIQTHQAHEAERTNSDLLYKGVLTDKARTVFRGMIRVEPEGQRTDAFQTNRNLVLSPDARADSIPGLEIEADDVRCSHSAAASPIDEEQIFYLMSRAIPEREARTMLVYGFIDDVLQQARIESIRQKLEDATARLLA